MAVRLRAGLRFASAGQDSALRVATRCGAQLGAGQGHASCPAAQLDVVVRPLATSGATRAALIELTVHAHAPLDMLGAVLDVPADLDGRELDLFGYQSWSSSGTYPDGARPRNLAAPLRATPFAAYGDLAVARADRDLTRPTSHEVLLAAGEPTWLAGSLLGREVFTVWQAMGEAGDRFARGVLDVGGMSLAAGEQRVIGRVAVIWAPSRTAALDAFRSVDDVEPLPAPRVTGWCSWYEHYQHIDSSKLLTTLRHMRSAHWPAPAVFQVDDGYQRSVGDWLELKDEAFEGGMYSIAIEAAASGYTPGIWVAPFVASRASRLAREHPDYLARDAHGRRVVAGVNPAWGGPFYALDLTRTDVLDYLATALRTMREEWGFQFFKLDFLYAAALAPPPGMTRAQAMRRGMELLRAWCGDAAILGCGVPLVSAAGLVEYCRIGADVAARWDSPIERASGSRERVSTVSSLASTLTRWWLDGHYFGADPDVIILRDWDSDLSIAEIDTLATVNALLGSLVFCSDNLERYEEAHWRQLRRMFPLPDARIEHVEVAGAHRFELTESGTRYELVVNLTNGPCRLADGAVLDSHASRCRRLPEPNDRVLGSTGYVLPGGEVLSTARRGSRLTLRLRPGFAAPSTIELRPDERVEQVVAGGHQVPFSRDPAGRLLVHLP